MEISTIEVDIILPKKDFSGWDSTTKLKVKTEFNPAQGVFYFKAEIPQFVFDKVKDTDEKYDTNPPKEDWSSKNGKKFTRGIKADSLSYLVSRINDVCSDAMTAVETENAKSEKYIAVRFTCAHAHKRDEFNFADMGHHTSSGFQFFTVYKVIQSPNSLNRYIYRSDKRVQGAHSMRGNNDNRKWFYFGIGVLRTFQLIKWTQEREDFLQAVTDKFVSINSNLEKFLGNIDEDKIVALMENKTFLQLTQ